MKGVCRAGTSDFCPALAALVGPEQNKNKNKNKNIYLSSTVTR
jgi:hypothetical protein